MEAALLAWQAWSAAAPPSLTTVLKFTIEADGDYEEDGVRLVAVWAV